MKYNISIDQKAIIENKLKLDIKDAVIMDFMRHLSKFSKVEKILIDTRVFFWVNYSYLAKENPLLGLKSDSIYRRILNLQDCGLIEPHPDNQKLNRSYYSFTEKFEEIFEGKEMDDLRMKIRTSRVTSGLKSEGGTDENPKVPTDENPDDNINIYSLLDNNKSDNIILDFFPEKKSEDMKHVNSFVKKSFLAKYKKEFEEDYYFEAKDSGQTRPLALKIYAKIKEKKGEVRLQDFKNGILAFFEMSYILRTDFFLKDYNLTNINTKFNDIFTRIKERSNGNQQIPTKQPGKRAGVTDFKFNVPDPRKQPR